MAGVIPECVALVLCRRIERDAATHNPTLVGAFSAIQVDSFPMVTDPFAIWVQVSNGHGAFRMQIRIAHVRPDLFEADPVATFEFSWVFADPRVVHEYAGSVADGLYLAHAGDYLVTLTANGLAVAQRYLTASAKA